MPFLTRYADDESRPRLPAALRDLAVRVLAPAVLLWLVVVGVGRLIIGPLSGLPSETAVNRTLQSSRTPWWDAVTMVWSRIGNTEIVIGVCIVAVAVVWWLTRQWWLAVVPAVAIAVQASVFVLATAVTGRARPDVAQLDPAPPTSSYPSGHVGASVALYLTFAALAQRIRNPLVRRTVTAVCLVIPLLVAYARLYRGMHHLTDVLVGFLNGLASAALAWAYLRRDTRVRPERGGPG